MRILIFKARRRLVLMDGAREVFQARVGLGFAPEGAKRHEGDGRTPEGEYFICLVKEHGRHGYSLGLSYPGPKDADLALAQGRIDGKTHEAIHAAAREHRRPPWGSPLGGEIFIHAGGASQDWTQGCIALEPKDMARIFALRDQIQSVEILPE